MNAEIIEKIKKLLRLGQSSNPHEAGLALQRAFELAQRHGVDVADLDLDERLEKLVHEYFKCPQRVDYLRKRIFNLLVRFFRVEVCVAHRKVVFVGRETDVQIAGYVYEFLAWAGNKGWREFESAERARRRVINQAKRQNYFQGFIYGIAQQLEGSAAAVLDDNKTALVVTEKEARCAYMDQLVPNTTPLPLAKVKRSLGALMSGFNEGKKTQINQPLNAGKQETFALE